MMRLEYLLIFILFFGCQDNSTESKQQESLQKTFENAAVVSAHPLATAIGVDILKSGGNVFDASVSVQFALAVVYPSAGNIGGGGFAVFVDSLGHSGTLDFREKAPMAAHRDMYLDSSGNVVPNASTLGVLSAGVPGTVRGMWELHRKYGLIPWKELIQPSVTMAQNGWILTEKEATRLNRYRDILDSVNRNGSYLTFQDSWSEGDTIRNTALSRTLERIRDGGPEGFYQGRTADMIVQTMEDYGGLITHEDLQNYEAVWRDPVEGSFQEYRVISMPPPSSGGIALLSMLKMIENKPVGDWGRWDTRTIHLMAEIEKRIYADRSEYLGDPDFFDVPVAQLLDEGYLKMRAKSISMDSATPSEWIRPGLEMVPETEETTHFSIVDKYGNAISVTTTLNGAFGSNLVVEGAGFLLNNEMDDFSIKPGHPNLYGLIGGEANAIEAGKRMLSSMTPTIVLHNDEVKMIVGSPGGSTIITSVFQNILNVLEFQMTMQTSVDLPRFHHQWLPDLIYYEEGFLNYADSLSLTEKGQTLKKRSPIGRVDAIAAGKNGSWEVGADPRGDDFGDGY